MSSDLKIDVDDVTEIVHALRHKNFAQAAGRIVGILTSVAATLAGGSLPADKLAKISGALTEAATLYLTSDPNTEPFLAAGVAYDEQVAYIRQVSLAVVKRVNEAMNPQFDQVLILLARHIAGLEELNAGQRETNKRLDAMSETLARITPTSVLSATPRRRNHLLIPHETSFNMKLRDALFEQESRMSIAVDAYTLYREAHPRRDTYNHWWKAYESGWQAFLDDDEAGWLFTVHPEERADDALRWEAKKIHSLLVNLRALGKRVAFFESGQHFIERAGAISELAADCPVISLATDYRRAVELMLGAAAPHLRNSDPIVIFTLLGPDAEAANARRGVYNRFVAEILRRLRSPEHAHPEINDHARVLDSGSSQDSPNMRRILQRVCPQRVALFGCAMKQWCRREDASKLMEHELLSMQPAFDRWGDKATIVLLCGNDDIALGALDALQTYLKPRDGGPGPKLLVFGFDGLDDMVRMIEARTKNVVALTALVDLKEMIDRAARAVGNGHLPVSWQQAHHQVQAEIICQGG